MRFLIKKDGLKDFEHFIIRDVPCYMKLPIEKITEQGLRELNQQIIDRFMDMIAEAKEVEDPAAYL